MSDIPLKPDEEAVAQDKSVNYDAIPVLDASRVATEVAQENVGMPVSLEARQLAQHFKVSLKECVGTGPHGRIESIDVKKVHDNSLENADGIDDLTIKGEVNSEQSNLILKSGIESSHVRLVADVKIDALLNYLQNLNETNTSENILLNDLIIKASAVALMAVPECNVHFINNEIVALLNANVAVSMSLAAEQVAPVVRAANDKSVVEICREAQELTHKARENSLEKVDLDDASFTIFDLGVMGIKQFDAVIRTPQCCALGVGCGELRAVVVGGGVGVAMMMTMSLSLDPRAVDEIAGAKFLRVLKKAIENPNMLER